MIISDSLGQPRSHDGIDLLYSETWPYMLNRYYEDEFDVFLPILSKYGFDTNELKGQFSYYPLIDTSLIFIHVGIVDCARRAIGKKTLQVIKNIPILRGLIRKFTQKYHFGLSKIFKITYTTEKKYEQNLKSFFSRMQEKQIFIIPILPVGKVMKAKSYGIQEQISKYNEILKNLSDQFSNVIFLDYIELAFVPNIDELTFSDSYHLNHAGQKLLFDEIKRGVAK